MTKMKIILTFFLLTFSLPLLAQTYCDSLSVAPDTIYLNQSTDSTVLLTFTYTGNTDLSYAHLTFDFPDSSNLDINDDWWTGGFNGAYSFPAYYDVIYNNQNIPSNTIVNCWFNAYHHFIPSQPIFDCNMPVTFIINATTGIKQGEHPVNINITPNPFSDRLKIETENLQTKPITLLLFDIMGRKVLQTKIKKNITILHFSELSSGTYFLHFQTEEGVVTKKIIKN